MFAYFLNDCVILFIFITSNVDAAEFYHLGVRAFLKSLFFFIFKMDFAF
jgi:uncharacterized integral membrane protein